MGLLEELIDGARGHDEEISDAIMSPYWTMIVTGACGVSSTLGYQPGCGSALKKTILASRTPALLDLAFSEDLAEASVGIAALNSILNRYFEPGRKQAGLMPRARNKRVAVVGRFHFIDRLKELSSEVWTISSALGEGDYPESEAPSILHVADVSIIDGAMLVNHSLERHLRWAEPSYTIVFGPSTPLSPILFRYGANQVGGIKVTNADRVAACVASGAESLAECPGIAPIVLRAPEHRRP
jgi:uncharacterized protein (DUF4213/DUF364 family)